MNTIKGFADAASGLGFNMASQPKGKVSVTQQSKMAAEIDAKIQVIKSNTTLACQELYQLMSDIVKTKMTKPRQVKIFGYKNLDIEGVTKENFKDVELLAKASPSENSQENKQIKQKAKIDLFNLFKDDPKVPGQTAMRRSVAKTFDIPATEIEDWFSGGDEPASDMTPPGATAAPGAAAPAAPATADGTMNEATPGISQTAINARANVPMAAVAPRSPNVK